MSGLAPVCPVDGLRKREHFAGEVDEMVETGNPKPFWSAVDLLAQAVIDSLNTRAAVGQGVTQISPVPVAERNESTPAVRTAGKPEPQHAGQPVRGPRVSLREGVVPRQLSSAS